MATSLNKINSELHAAAAARRQAHPSQPHLKEARYTAFNDDYMKRTEFRRIINTSILRKNSRDVSLKSLEILLQLSQNIITHPNKDQYRRFKPTNDAITQFIIRAEGAVEYAVAMGFRAQVEDFQPYYTFNEKFMKDLCIGNEILKTRLKEEQIRVEEEEQAAVREKARKEARHAKAMQKFMEDRHNVKLRVEREQEGARLQRQTSIQTSARSLGSIAERLKF